MEVIRVGLLLAIFCDIFHLLHGSSESADERLGENVEYIQEFETYVLQLRHEVMGLKSEMTRMQVKHNRDIANLRTEIGQIRDSFEVQMENMLQKFDSKISICQAEVSTAMAKIKKEDSTKALQPELNAPENFYESHAEITMIDVQVRSTFETVNQRSSNQLPSDAWHDQTNDKNTNMTEGNLFMAKTDKTGLKFPKGNRQRVNLNSTGPIVAFFAKLSIDALNLGINQPVCFDNVVTNYGNVYDKSIGIFRAPIAGLYLFSVTITTYGNDRGHFGIFVNESQETGLFVNGPENPFDDSSQTIIIHLVAGSNVTVRSIYEGNKGARGDQYSVFSGTLLFAD